MKNLQFAPTPKPSRDCQGAPMGLRPTHGDEKPSISSRLQPSRDCEGAVHYRANSKRFFKGVPMDLRPTNDNEKLTGCRLGAGSVSGLVWSFFSSAR